MPFAGLLLGHVLGQDWWRAWYPEVLLFAGFAVALHVWTCQRVRERYGDALTGGETGTEARYVVPLFLGLLCVFLSEGTPIHALAEHYLFSIHMLQHVLLFYVAAPLLLLSIPGWVLHPVTKYPFWDRLLRFATNPIFALLLFNGQYAFWHLPRMYQAALFNHNIHMLQHAVNMLAALLVWWPVVGRSKDYRPLSDAARVLYIFLFSVAGIGVYGYVTFESEVLYPFYSSAPRLWGISVEHDQVISGIIMKLGTAVVMVTTFLAALIRWFKNEEDPDKSALRWQHEQGEAEAQH